MKQSEHLNPSEETGTGCPVTSKDGWKDTSKQAWRCGSTTTTTGVITYQYMVYLYGIDQRCNM